MSILLEVRGEVRGDHQESCSIALHVAFLRQGFFMNPRVH